MSGKTAVFFDRDGTINKEAGYINSLQDLHIYPNAVEAVRLVNDAGMKVLVITNQSGVARGLIDENFLSEIHGKIRDHLARHGAVIDGFYYCPHHPTIGSEPYRQQCGCRKPEPGMLIRAAEDHGIDLGSSYVIGDHASDIQVAKRVSAKGILVKTGHGLEHIHDDAKPDYIAEDVLDAVLWIIRDRSR
jgi:D-glycero-D-manno-heptose 1,7-bisphosphate phosphatase